MKKYLGVIIYFIFNFASVAQAASMHPADIQLDSMIKNYENSDSQQLGKNFDESMIGFTQLQESVKVALNVQRQIKIKLGAKRFTKAKEIYVIQCDWEKSYLMMPNLIPKKVSGRTLFLFQFKNKEWKLASLSGDNIFSL